MHYSEFINPLHLYRKRHRMRPFLVDELGGALRCQLANLGLFLHPNERRLRALKGCHAGSRAFLIGTGPSLRMADLEALQGDITLASNKIFLAFDQTDWRPTYYAIEDRLAISEALGHFPQFPETTKLIPFRRFRETERSAEPIYFNLSSKPFYPGTPGFSFNSLVRIQWGSTVSYSLIQLAFYMGIRELYLLGVDFDYTGMETPDQGNQAHTVSGKSNLQHHFHKNYYAPGAKTHPPNLKVQYQSYKAAQAAADRLGVRIFNATRGGKLDVFPRVDFDRLMSRALENGEEPTSQHRRS